LFDDPRHDELSSFIRGKSLFTTNALTAAPNLPAVSNKSRINDFGIVSSTKWTKHAL
jgi:hypothetical protein